MEPLAPLHQRYICSGSRSLVNPELLEDKKEDCVVYDSARMTLEEVFSVMKETEAKGLTTVRLHSLFLIAACKQPLCKLFQHPGTEKNNHCRTMGCKLRDLFTLRHRCPPRHSRDNHSLYHPAFSTEFRNASVRREEEACR